MPLLEPILDLNATMVAWRHDFHRHPELLYEVPRTAGVVADSLRTFGFDRVETGVGRSGVVGVLHGRQGAGTKVIGLRADMDALPIAEATGKPYASLTPGRMHACGHDGHTAMLLGAARYLSETRRFDGTAVFVFQPAEEGGAGARAMLEDGLVERFGVQEIYGMHNHPGLAVGGFAIRPGPIMASADWFDIEIEGVGGHAAKPRDCVDPILVAGHLTTAVQSIVSRNAGALDAAVVSITRIAAGDAYNVIPQSASLHGTVRTLQPEMRDVVESRLGAIVAHTAAAFGASARLDYRRDYPVTVNHPRQTEFAAAVAEAVAGAERVERNVAPELGAEDFAFMLEAIPGAFIFAGNGASAGHHHPEFDFNDDLLAVGASFWAKLVETAMPLEPKA